MEIAVLAAWAARNPSGATGLTLCGIPGTACSDFNMASGHQGQESAHSSMAVGQDLGQRVQAQ